MYSSSNSLLVVFISTIYLNTVNAIKCRLNSHENDCELIENTFIFNNNRPSHVEKAECVKVCCYREDREGANFESNQKNNLCFPKPKDIEDCKELQANQQFINAENYYEDTTCKYHIYNT